MRTRHAPRCCAPRHGDPARNRTQRGQLTVTPCARRSTHSMKTCACAFCYPRRALKCGVPHGGASIHHPRCWLWATPSASDSALAAVPSCFVVADMCARPADSPASSVLGAQELHSFAQPRCCRVLARARAASALHPLALLGQCWQENQRKIMGKS